MKSKKNLKFREWQHDVLTYLRQVKEKLDGNKESKLLYKGFRVFYSDFKINPNFLFIGINPGAGHDQQGEIIVDATEDSFFDEYGWGNARIATHTKEVFERAGLTRYFRDNHSHVTTNFFYLLTSRENDINKCLRLAKFDVANFNEKSSEFTERLIEIIRPKIIICQGKTAYENVKALSMFRNNISKESGWKDGQECGYCSFDSNSIIVLGYARLFSNIKNRAALAKTLKNLVQKHNIDLIDL